MYSNNNAASSNSSNNVFTNPNNQNANSFQNMQFTNLNSMNANPNMMMGGFSNSYPGNNQHQHTGKSSNKSFFHFFSNYIFLINKNRIQ